MFSSFDSRDILGVTHVVKNHGSYPKDQGGLTWGQITAQPMRVTKMWSKAVDKCYPFRNKKVAMIKVFFLCRFSFFCHNFIFSPKKIDFQPECPGLTKIEIYIYSFRDGL